MREPFNPIRRYCKANGIKGKGKKKLRRELARVASAKSALELLIKEKQTMGGLINAL